MICNEIFKGLLYQCFGLPTFKHMKNMCLLLLSLFSLQTTLPSQRIGDVSYSIDRQGQYVFTCNNKDYCPYILHLDFTTLTNARADQALPYEAEVRPGINMKLTTSPIIIKHHKQDRIYH